MQVRQLMKENPICITEDCSLKEAAQLMAQVDCGVLPICEGSKNNPSKKPIGVVTDRDIVVRCVAEGCDPETTTIRDAETQDTVTCEEECSARDAFEQMRAEKIGRLLVVDDAGRLTGIVTMADIIANSPAEIWNQLPGSKEPRPRNKIAA